MAKRDMIGGPIGAKNVGWLPMADLIEMNDQGAFGRQGEISIKNTRNPAQTIKLKIDKSSTTDDVKSCVTFLTGIPSDRQVLKRVVKDGFLKESGIENNDTLWFEEKSDEELGDAEDIGFEGFEGLEEHEGLKDTDAKGLKGLKNTPYIPFFPDPAASVPAASVPGASVSIIACDAQALLVPKAAAVARTTAAPPDPCASVPGASVPAASVPGASVPSQNHPRRGPRGPSQKPTAVKAGQPEPPPMAPAMQEVKKEDETKDSVPGVSKCQILIFENTISVPAASVPGAAVPSASATQLVKNEDETEDKNGEKKDDSKAIGARGTMPGAKPIGSSTAAIGSIGASVPSASASAMLPMLEDKKEGETEDKNGENKDDGKAKDQRMRTWGRPRNYAYQGSLCALSRRVYTEWTMSDEELRAAHESA